MDSPSCVSDDTPVVLSLKCPAELSRHVLNSDTNEVYPSIILPNALWLTQVCSHRLCVNKYINMRANSVVCQVPLQLVGCVSV